MSIGETGSKVLYTFEYIHFVDFCTLSSTSEAQSSSTNVIFMYSFFNGYGVATWKGSTRRCFSDFLIKSNGTS